MMFDNKAIELETKQVCIIYSEVSNFCIVIGSYFYKMDAAYK